MIVLKIKYIYLDKMQVYFDRYGISREGIWYCTDKTSWILEKYKEYILTGQIPETNSFNQNFLKPVKITFYYIT